MSEISHITKQEPQVDPDFSETDFSTFRRGI